MFPLLVPANSKLINYEPTKASVKSVGCIASYAANTNQGISRNYNEDRVSIILNIAKGNTKCSFFAIYDGHGGSACCDYLRDSLHDHIIKQPTFLDNTRQALVSGVKAAESSFLESVSEDYQKNKKLDRSGSCGIITLVMGETCYVANIGDSRAVLSAESGKYAYNLSRDHKPTDLHEQRRIEEAGGKIYKTEVRSLVSGYQDDVVSGPLRVYPGKLSVTRTFGDVEAKDERFGGNSKVVVAEPEIKHFEIKPTHAFIILGSDGIFDKLDSKDVVKIVWQTVEIFRDRGMTIH